MASITTSTDNEIACLLDNLASNPVESETTRPCLSTEVTKRSSSNAYQVLFDQIDFEHNEVGTAEPASVTYDQSEYWLNDFNTDCLTELGSNAESNQQWNKRNSLGSYYSETSPSHFISAEHTNTATFHIRPEVVDNFNQAFISSATTAERTSTATSGVFGAANDSIDFGEFVILYIFIYNN